MAIPKKRRRDPILDMGPFSDVAFLLICFFVLTASFIQPMGKLMDIPQATQNTSKEEEQKGPMISLLPDQLLYGTDEDNMRPMDFASLRDLLLSSDFAAKHEQDCMIIVNVAKGTPYDVFFKVVTAVSEAGAIAVLIEEESEGEDSGDGATPATEGATA